MNGSRGHGGIRPDLRRRRTRRDLPTPLPPGDRSRHDAVDRLSRLRRHPPEHRRKGYIRALVRSFLEEYRDRAVPLSALWAFDYPFYDRFGWDLANQYAVRECPTGALESVTAHAGGDFVRLGPDEGEGGTATVETTAAGPDGTIGIGALSQLVVGYRTPAALDAAGELTVVSSETRTLLDAAFPSRDVFLREQF